ncbi:MAG TPA: hypothetical protein ENG96_04990 [Gammaproteobacteria bacterium]|nr:hypothetical protein [Gammaproteobacteria bacterium]
MFYPCDNYGFSVPVVSRSKAQREGNGHFLAEYWDAAEGDHRDALQVSLSTPMDYVAPLDKGITIACEARLAMSLDKLTEPVIIRFKEH